MLPAFAFAPFWLTFGCLSQSDRAALLSTSWPRP